VCRRAHFQREGMSQKKIRCVLLHDHVLLRQGLRRLLEDEPDMEIVAEAGDAAEGLHRVFELRPDVVIADAGIFGCEALLAERLVMRESPKSKVLFLHRDENETLTRAVPYESSTGRQTSAEELVEMVRRAHSPGALREMPRRGRPEMGSPIASRKRALTAREREVLKLLAEGRTVRSVAELMGLSVKTVDAHKFNLMRKLGIHNKAELVMWAIQKRVVKLPANF
jgi:two-component system, NarL family, response regulator NreC